MKQILTKKAVALAVVMSLIFIVSCTRDTVQDTTLPSYQISVSEQLGIPASVGLPENLPSGNTRVATFFAEGVQKYKAQQVAGSDPAVYQWILLAPKANLYDANNQKAGTHTIGPSWQLSATDSLFGQQFTPAKTAPGTDQSSVDWLQLMPKAGTVPTGIFANVAYIQRIATKGGKAPATAPVSITDTIDVKYTAIYRFTKKNP
jgi:hypothetical protein